MNPKPRLLDLFCGAGGCSVGYHRAGFEVVGVDINPQPNYPYDFVQADALEYADHWKVINTFQAIHASPPCQHYSTITAADRRDDHPDLIDPVRELLIATKLPYVIENVEGARGRLRDPYLLCGSMMGLGVRRHRYFETNFPLLVPTCAHGLYEPKYETRHTKRNRALERFIAVTGGGQQHGVGHPERSKAMGIDWMNWHELRESIPPAFTELIGHQLLAHLKGS